MKGKSLSFRLCVTRSKFKSKTAIQYVLEFHVVMVTHRHEQMHCGTDTAPWEE